MFEFYFRTCTVLLLLIDRSVHWLLRVKKLSLHVFTWNLKKCFPTMRLICNPRKATSQNPARLALSRAYLGKQPLTSMPCQDMGQGIEHNPTKCSRRTFETSRHASHHSGRKPITMGRRAEASGKAAVPPPFATWYGSPLKTIMSRKRASTKDDGLFLSSAFSERCGWREAVGVSDA